jgi:hypothetical protein
MCGMISSNVFPSTEAPRFRKGVLINIGLCAAGVLFTIINAFLLRLANKRKAQAIASGQAAKLTDEELADLGDRNPWFKYTI